jgi:hypothetical protein
VWKYLMERDVDDEPDSCSHQYWDQGVEGLA